jgi:hypothetical protein
MKGRVVWHNFEVKLVCNGIARQISQGIAPCNMVSFMKLSCVSVARQFHEK